MNDLEVIDILALAGVTGGALEQGLPNTDKANGNLGITVPTHAGNVQVGLQASYERTRSDYGQCVDQVRASGGKPSEFRAACGLPNGQS